MPDIRLRKHVARNLKRLREERRHTQEGLAERAGVSWHVVSKIERNDSTPTLETLNSLCRGLRISLAEFLAQGAREEEVELIIDRLRYYPTGKPLAVVEFADQLVRNAVTLVEAQTKP